MLEPMSVGISGALNVEILGASVLEKFEHPSWDSKKSTCSCSTHFYFRFQVLFAAVRAPPPPPPAIWTFQSPPRPTLVSVKGLFWPPTQGKRGAPTRAQTIPWCSKSTISRDTLPRPKDSISWTKSKCSRKIWGISRYSQSSLRFFFKALNWIWKRKWCIHIWYLIIGSKIKLNIYLK